MKLKRVNNRILEIRNDGWFWDSQITKKLAECILSLKNEQEVELKTEDATLWVEREEKKFLVNIEERDEDFGTVYSNFILWQSDLERIANSLERKPTRETLRTAVNAPLYPKYRSSIRAFKKALRRAKRRSCYLGGFTEIRSITSLSAGKFLRQKGFRILPDGEVFHPRGRKSTAEKASSYKIDNWLRGAGLQ